MRDAYIDYVGTAVGAAAFRRFRHLLYGQPDALVTTLIENEIANFRPSSRHVSVCDVGGGDGLRAARIAGYLERCHGVVCQVDIVDPSGPLTAMAARGTVPGRVRVFRQRIEEFRPTRKYDLLLALHSIYGQEPGRLLDRSDEFLTNTGMALIVFNGSAGFVGRAKAVLDSDLAGRKYEGPELVADLEERKINFSHRLAGLTGSLRPQDIDGIMEWISMGRWTGMASDRRSAIASGLLGSISASDLIGFHEEEEIVTFRRRTPTGRE